MKLDFQHLFQHYFPLNKMSTNNLNIGYSKYPSIYLKCSSKNLVYLYYLTLKRRIESKNNNENEFIAITAYRNLLFNLL